MKITSILAQALFNRALHHNMTEQDMMWETSHTLRRNGFTDVRIKWGLKIRIIANDAKGNPVRLYTRVLKIDDALIPVGVYYDEDSIYYKPHLYLEV